VVRFGAGSPYLDIKLPCGGGLDIHFQPLADGEFVQDCLAAIRARAPFAIRVGAGRARCLAGWHKPSFDGETGTFGHWPVPLLQIIGHGAGVEALARQAAALGCETRVLTPDERIIDRLEAAGIAVGRLERTDQTNLLTGDPWTANIFLFHDHDWEDVLMARALELPHFYLGAMGGRKAHERRCDALLARGVSAAQLAGIHAPIGLFHSSRDPQTLALSTLAQVIRTYEETDFEAGFD
jgi:xanthine dehydrogenase accessory factor